ncbi:hypothetical protein [Streptosporangium sp. NPDC049046]|uniref:hypothetical protein n=1 Tax=Streptosporangium sp. NPDC049046 TaxID=3155031 RepID=UPI00341D9E94
MADPTIQEGGFRALPPCFPHDHRVLVEHARDAGLAREASYRLPAKARSRVKPL